MAILPANIAFYLILAIIPLLTSAMIITSTTGLVNAQEIESVKKYPVNISEHIY